MARREVRQFCERAASAACDTSQATPVRMDWATLAGLLLPFVIGLWRECRKPDNPNHLREQAQKAGTAAGRALNDRLRHGLAKHFPSLSDGEIETLRYHVLACATRTKADVYASIDAAGDAALDAEEPPPAE